MAIAHGFQRSARLRQSRDFQRCFVHGERLNGRFFRLYRLSQVEPARLGLAVSSKVDSRAVGRNRIKRIVREDFRRRRVELPAADYVLVAKREAASAEASALRIDLANLWQRVLALKPKHGAGTMPGPVGPLEPRGNV